jgi:hypothetical protein
MFSGGERIGVASIQSSSIEGKDGGCVTLTATVPWKASSRPLLATSALTEILSHSVQRRPATASEIATLRRLAIAWLAEYGLDKQLLSSGSMGSVTSTILRQDAGRALIGRFDVISKRSIHRLFAVAERVADEYALTLTDLNVQQGIEDEKDKVEQELLDQLDIDNDGHDEVITSVLHHEGWSYTIWRFNRKDGVWFASYTGGGGGC